MAVSPAEKISRQTEGMGRRCCGDGLIQPEVPVFNPGVIWNGVMRGWSGYAKANRNLLFRVANHVHVQLEDALAIPWTFQPDESRLAAHEKIRVGLKAPFLRFFGPDTKNLPLKRRKIIYTMMETEVVHRDMVDQINSRFDELWTPTVWGENAFRRSGVRIPTHTAPLGVDTLVYRPMPGQKAPSCRLLSTDRAGQMEKPEGFLFISVGLPSFRKGFDLLSAAFEDAFAGDPDVALVCAVTHASSNVDALAQCGKMKSRIYALEGTFDEHEMAKVYAACNAYVTASRGEGWNLPLCEAAATGLPVICPRNTTHSEVAGNDAFFFDDEGQGVFNGSESVSPWYKGVPFSVFGKKSHAELVELLRVVRENREGVSVKAAGLRQKMFTEWSWNTAAELMAHRLLEVQ